MRNASSAYLVAAEKGGEIKVRLRLVNQAGEETWIENQQIVSNSVKFKNETSSDSSFDVGAVIISSFEFSLYNYNDVWTDYDFTRCIIDGYVGYDVVDESNAIATEDDSGHLETEHGEMIEVEEGEALTQYIRMGQYYMVSHKAVGNIMKCEAYDALILMDRNVANLTFTGSITVFQAIQQLCNARGITLANATIPHGDLSISTLPEDEMTERQMLSYLLQLISCYGRMNSEGNLYVGWYDLTSPIDIPVMFSTSLQTNSVVFTGVRIEGDDDLYYETSAAEGLYMVISGNPFITEDNIGSVADIIWNTINGMSFSAGEFACRSLPTYEVGDTFRFLDAKGRTRVVPATSVTYTPSLKETIRCGAAAEEVDDLRPTSISVSANRVRKDVDQKVSTVQAHFDAFSRMLGASFGLYQTEETLSDGSTIFYLHDQPTLAESKTVWKATANAFAVTNDYNAEDPDASPWVAGVDKNGNMIAQVLTTIGINVEWINLDGTLRDSNGTNWWNLQTGEFHISALSGYTTTDQHATDMAAMSQSIQDNKDYTDTEVAALRTDAETMASTAEQNAKDYTDGELSDMNDAWDQDFTDYQTTVNHQLSVLSDEFSSRIEEAKTEVTTHYFVPATYPEQWHNQWRYNSVSSYITSIIRNGRKCTCLDGTNLTAYNSTYVVWWKVDFNGSGTAASSIEFELDGIAEGENLTRQVFFPFFYYPSTSSSPVYAGGSMYLGITDGTLHVQYYNGTELTPVDGVYNASIAKSDTSADNTQEELRVYFVPGHKLYLYNVSLTMTTNAYTDSSVSLIEQKANAIELRVEQLSDNSKQNYIPDDYTDPTDWEDLGDNNLVSTGTFDGNTCAVLDGSNSPASSVGISEEFIFYKIPNITQIGEYSFEFTYGSDVALDENKDIAVFWYGSRNPDTNQRETIPVILKGFAHIKSKSTAAGSAITYTGKFTIPSTTSYTHDGQTYTGNTEIMSFTTAGGVLLGPFAIGVYLPPGGHGYFYNFSVYGSASDYARSVLSVARNEIAAEVTRAQGAESDLSSRITVTENSISSEISQRQSDYQTLSSAITQTSQAIEAKVSKGDIASTINQTAQSVKISASKIDLSGYVTVSSLGSGGTTTIDGSRITTGQISAERIALGDFNNMVQLDEKSYARWGFTIQSRPADGVWYEYTPVRDKYVSDYYTVNGGEYYRVKCRLWSTCTGATTTGGEGGTYMKTGIGLYCWKGDGTGAGIVYSNRVTATASGAYATIDQQLQIPATARKMKIFIQTDGRPPFAGRITVQNLTVTRAMSAELVVDGAITADKISAGAITVGKIGDSQVTTAKIADGNVTTAKIPNSAITSVKIVDGAITAGKIAANAVVAAKIAANAITTDKLNASAVTAAKIAAGAVTADKISANAIVVGKIADGNITTAKLASNAVTAVKIQDGAITAGKIAANAVTAAKIAANAITAEKISANAITAAKIAATAIDGKTITGAIFKSSGKGSLTDANAGVYISASGIALGKSKAFYVDSNGALNATSATIKGTITGSTIGSTTISASTILVGNAAQNTAKLFISGATGDVWTGNLNIMTGDGTPIGGWYQDYDTRWNATSQNGKYLRILTGYGIHVGSTTGANGVNAYSIFSGGVVFEQQVYNNSGSVMFTSDIRKKKDVQDLSREDVISFVMQLRPVSFRFKSDEEERLHHGFIAQEVEEIIDADWAIVDTDENDEEHTKYLAYDELIADLVTVVQEQQEKIDSLEARIAKLETLLGV